MTTLRTGIVAGTELDPANPKPGAYSGVSFADYRRIDAVNNSLLKHMRDGVAATHYAKMNPTEPDKSMRLGSGLHFWKLERDKFADAVLVTELASRRGKAWEAIQAANHDKLILLEDEFESVKAMGREMTRHKKARELAAAVGEVEVVYVWQDKDTGLWLKARADKLVMHPTVQTIDVELKTAADVSEWKFSDAIWKLCYHTQFALRIMAREALGLEPAAYRWIVVRNEPYHRVRVYTPSDDMLYAGQQEVLGWLRRWAQAVASNNFEDETEYAELIDLPAHAAKRFER